MPISSGFNHIATITPDLDRTVAFYASVFEAEVTFEMVATADHPRMTILDLGGNSALNCFEAAPEEILGDRRKQGGRGPIDHYGIAVDSHQTL